MLLVPKGRSLVGGVQVELDSFYLATYPVTNAQYLEFIQSTGYAAPNVADVGFSIWTGLTFPKEKADHPVVCVNWNDAQAYCKWAGVRLPRELEWEKAASGTDGRRYPWGNFFSSGEDIVYNCRHSLNRGSETTASVSSYPRGRGPYGHFQMAGNIFEWCEDWFEESAFRVRYAKGDLSLPSSTSGAEVESARVQRGGCWEVHPSNDIYFWCSNRCYSRPHLRNFKVGFRVAK